MQERCQTVKTRRKLKSLKPQLIIIKTFTTNYSRVTKRSDNLLEYLLHNRPTKVLVGHHHDLTWDAKRSNVLEATNVQQCWDVPRLATALHQQN